MEAWVSEFDLKNACKKPDIMVGVWNPSAGEADTDGWNPTPMRDLSQRGAKKKKKQVDCFLRNSSGGLWLPYAHSCMHTQTHMHTRMYAHTQAPAYM